MVLLSTLVDRSILELLPDCFFFFFKQRSDPRKVLIAKSLVLVGRDRLLYSFIYRRGYVGSLFLRLSRVTGLASLSLSLWKRKSRVAAVRLEAYFQPRE